MRIPTFINHLADFDKLTYDVTNILDNVRTTVVKRVSKRYFCKYILSCEINRFCFINQHTHCLFKKVLEARYWP